MKYYIVAGEASGDLHASYLMRALRQRDPHADFRCWGGDRMEAEGGKIVKHYKDLAFMGFVEVALNLRIILNNINLCKTDILNYNPDALILVDYPGFNLRIAKFAKKKNIKVFYYISPQVWAWKKNRVHAIRENVDKMLTILPFEKDFYAKYDYPVEYVGHPLVEEIDDRVKNDGRIETFKQRHGFEAKPIVALLPGSRRQEISKMLPVMAAAADAFHDFQFVVSAVPSLPLDFYHKLLRNIRLPIVVDETYPLLLNARAALVTSGTATLETALLKVPEVVCYKGNPFSYLIARFLIKGIKYISLVNLIADDLVVKELIQNELNKKNITNELSRLLKDGEPRETMLRQYTDLKEKLGGSGASDKAAEVIRQGIVK
ncbi:MAG: lipid-A-disaccharide synthase [Bacteroidales bacterium]|nr:lipid-A-disaccharide synthase [Bacteroidales bacterium]